jgi:hypothetical protein
MTLPADELAHLTSHRAAWNRFAPTHALGQAA